jgi:hypothetical protein
MVRTLSTALAVAIALSLASAALAAAAPKKHHVTKHWHSCGFLPGYRPPEVFARERWEHYDRPYGQHYYGPAWPRFIADAGTAAASAPAIRRRRSATCGTAGNSRPARS